MSKYQIRPLKTGTIVVDKGAYITRGIDLGKEVKIPAPAWYLTDGQHKLMVDIGMCQTDLADWHHPGSWQEPGEAVHEKLEALGVDYADIELIIFTHLHWDHCHNLHMFPNARLLVNAREYEFALNPIPPYYKSYEHHKLEKKAPFVGRTFEKLDGEVEILPGIRIFPTPGHSPGHQSVSVDTEDGVHVIAGDAVFSYDNLDPAGEHLPFTLMGRFMDIVAAWRSLEDIVSRADVVLPGHDMRVLDTAVYQ
ncbi:MAG: N-acyl homoserine lactonase family protein [Desulfobacteraceae bacterium]|nr:MAG: N-acyl homoserine lactonase family protein [Desulfobacteraceae bacterium]